jgi:cell division protein FtsL
MGLALGLSACLVGSATGIVWIEVEQVLLSYRLDALRAAKSELDELNRQLRVELATLRSFTRIDEKALGELGMAPPSPQQVRLAREFVTGGDGIASLRTAWESPTHASGTPSPSDWVPARPFGAPRPSAHSVLQTGFPPAR